MFERLHCRAGHYVLLAAIALSLFFPNLGGPSLWDLDEGKNATCAWEMMLSGNWVTPTFNGDLRVDKPALLYWLQIAAYYGIGVNEFAARLPSALAALATVLLCYELARSMFSSATGMLAGVIAAATPMLCGAARFANPDSLLNLCVVLTLTLYWIGRDRPRLGWFAAIGAVVGLGVLAKGPVALVLPGGIIGLHLAWGRRLSLILDRRHFLGILVFVLVAVPWYLRVSLETKGEFASGFFFNHNLGRALSPMEKHDGSVLYYPIVLILGTVPWSVFLVPALWVAFWSALRKPGARWHAWWENAADGVQIPEAERLSSPVSAYRLLICWIGLWLICCTIAATKLPNYILPVIVPTGILLARFLDRWRLGELHVPVWILHSTMALLALVGVGVGMGLLVAGGGLPTVDLRGGEIEGLRPWALIGVAPLASALAGAWCLRTERRTGLIGCVAAAGVLFLAPLAAMGVTAVEGHKSVRALVESTGALQCDRDIRVVSWQLDHLPSLNFYVQRTVQRCSLGSEVATYLEYPLPVFVFLPASEWERLQPTVRVACREVAREFDLYTRHEVVVITNR